MKILRIIAAMVLALLAALLMWGEVGLMLEHEKLPIIQHLSAFAIALGFAASALYFSRSTSYWASNLSCPHCSQRATLSLSAFPQPRISILAWILGGVVFAALYRQARKHRFHCDACNEDSSLRTCGSWLAAAWLLLLIFVLIAMGYDAATS